MEKKPQKVVPKEKWEAGRLAWEVDPTMSLTKAAEIIGVSKQVCARRAKAEGWQKTSTNEAMLQKAHEVADARTAGLEVAQPPKDVSKAKTVEVTDPAQAAVDVRASILERHRKEWDGARKNIYKAVQNSDFDTAKLGKITAEALSIVQAGERKAWGLDKAAETPSVVVIERR